MTHASWGPGWPNCQGGRINRSFGVDTKQGRVTFPGGVRDELCELVARLVRETVNRGYRFGIPGNPSHGCWGYSCRAIRGSTRPSNHSWGLAVDINAPNNPMGSRLITNMPGWMPDLWNAYGFRWGGDYQTRPDAMHYEFMGSVADAAGQTQHARNNRLGEGVAVPRPPAPEEDDDMAWFRRVTGPGRAFRVVTSEGAVGGFPSMAEAVEYVNAFKAAGYKEEKTLAFAEADEYDRYFAHLLKPGAPLNVDQTAMATAKGVNAIAVEGTDHMLAKRLDELEALVRGGES